MELHPETDLPTTRPPNSALDLTATIAAQRVLRPRCLLRMATAQRNDRRLAPPPAVCRVLDLGEAKGVRHLEKVGQVFQHEAWSAETLLTEHGLYLSTPMGSDGVFEIGSAGIMRVPLPPDPADPARTGRQQRRRSAHEQSTGGGRPARGRHRSSHALPRRP
jgi:hypothetical protein